MPDSAIMQGFMDDEGRGVNCDTTPVAEFAAGSTSNAETIDAFRARMKSEGVIRRASVFSLVQRMLAIVDAEPDDTAIRDALRIVNIVCRAGDGGGTNDE